MVTEEQIKEQYERFMSLIAEDARKDNLLKMYEVLGARLVEAPASPRVHWHNAFPGGYLDHVLRVFDASLRIAKTYKEIGGSLNFTKQELTMAALHHDLGKLGDGEQDYYVDQDSDWHRKRGEYYKHNEQIQYMQVTDRALWLLQKFDVELTQTEWIAIKLSDGLYEEGNKAYLKNSMYPYPMHSNLPYIIHAADMMASAAERDQTRISFEDTP
jgi:hypothetical protein